MQTMMHPIPLRCSYWHDRTRLALTHYSKASIPILSLNTKQCDGMQCSDYGLASLDQTGQQDPRVSTGGLGVPGASILPGGCFLQFPTGFEIFWENRFFDPKMAPAAKIFPSRKGPR
eukprot:EG_transcript_31740